MANIYLVGAYARKGSIYEQIKYCPRYGAFKTQEDCDKQCEMLNKRAIRPQTYFSVPVPLVSKVKSASKNASNGSTTRGKTKKV